MVVIYEIYIIFQIVAQEIEKTRFQSAETIVMTGYVSLAEMKSVGIAFFCQLADERTSRLWNSPYFCRLVESLSCSIVYGLTYDFHVEIIIDFHNLSVTS